MPHRFHAPDLTGPGTLVVLPPGEATHLARVLRLRAGDRVAVFDGRGRQFEATVETLKPAVSVRIGVPLAAAPEPRVPLTLVQAVLKGDGMDGVVRDAVMLGAAAVQPVVTARAEVALTALRRGHRAERWRRIVLASVKQCGRATLPEVAEPVELDAALATAADLRLMLVEPGADTAGTESLDGLRGRPAPGSAALLVGPEGGWAPEELAAARAHGWTLLRLGGRTLRADAAPIVAISALWGEWGEL